MTWSVVKNFLPRIFPTHLAYAWAYSTSILLKIYAISKGYANRLSMSTLTDGYIIVVLTYSGSVGVSGHSSLYRSKE